MHIIKKSGSWFPNSRSNLITMVMQAKSFQYSSGIGSRPFRVDSDRKICGLMFG